MTEEQKQAMIKKLESQGVKTIVIKAPKPVIIIQTDKNEFGFHA